nr:unnamed protein product [Callosobruchus chinensis]
MDMMQELVISLRFLLMLIQLL